MHPTEQASAKDDSMTLRSRVTDTNRIVPAEYKLDEEKSKCAGLAQISDNKRDLIAAQYF